MDPNRLDDLARALGSGRSRRRILKTLAGGALGALAASVGLGAADAKQGGFDNSACVNFCNAAFQKSRDRSECQQAGAQGSGLCAACGANIANYCHGACLNVAADPSNCGSCGHACTTNVSNVTATCTNGVCGFACATGFTRCHGACVDLTSDAANCGSCDASCDDANLCTTDACVRGACVHTPIALTCTAIDQCHEAGTCNPATGQCTHPAAANGTACAGTDQCFQTYACQDGACTGRTPVVCGQCHGCDSTQGCVALPNIVTCDSGNGTCNDHCSDGTCVSGGAACDCGPGTSQCGAGCCSSTPGCCQQTVFGGLVNTSSCVC